ncbi:MAG: hypothetical protein FWH14_05295 [Oscillospiraceae bacterium]|nr:hypothetical protein [Oscillospiraceae bacterium]
MTMDSYGERNHEKHKRHEKVALSVTPGRDTSPKGRGKNTTGFAVITKKHPPLRRHPLCQRGQGLTVGYAPLCVPSYV